MKSDLSDEDRFEVVVYVGKKKATEKEEKV